MPGLEPAGQPRAESLRASAAPAPAGRLWPSFLPIPALVVLMAVTYFTVDRLVYYDPAWLILTGNTLFVGVIGFIVCYVAFRNYGATGRIQVLLLGCGVLVFGIGGVLAAVVRGMPGGANLNVTIYNTGAVLGGLFHFLAAFALLSGVAPEIGAARRRVWLALGYGGVVLFMAAVTAASLAGMTPRFFVQDVGPTPLRQAVLGSADILFVFSCLIFLGAYARSRERFLYWYACALALTAISLTAFFLESAVGSPLGWLGRCSQYLGGVYFLAAVVAAIRHAQVQGRPLDTAFVTALSGAEEKFRALAENAPDMIRRFDRGARHLYVNPAALRLYAKPASAVIGKPIGEAGLAPEYAAAWKDRIEEVFRTGRPVEVEESLPGPNGPQFLQSRCVPEYGAGESVTNVLVISRDLTQRKHQEDAALRANEEWRRTFDSVPDLIAIVDRNHRIVRANKAMAARLGLAASECAGLSCHEALHGTTSPPSYCPHSLTLLDGTEHAAEMHLDRLGGDFLVTTTALADGRGEMIGSVQVARDITERRQQARLLGAVNRILEEAIHCESVEALGEACLAVAESVTDSRFGFIGEIGPDRLLHTVAISNPGWEACDIQKGPGPRRPLGNFAIHGIYGRVLIDNESLITNDPAVHPDRIGTPDGHPPLTAFLGVPLVQEGRVSGMIALGNREGGYRAEHQQSIETMAPAIVEALARKRTELALRESEQRSRHLIDSERAARGEAERANRTKDEFLANLSHELRTPLNAILGWISILKGMPVDAGVSRGLDVIDRNARAQTQLISDLLDMSRILSGKLRLDLRHCSLPSIVESAVESLAPAAEVKAIRITTSIDPLAPVVLGDPDRLQQAFWNLLSNAVKFTPHGGQIAVAVGRTPSAVQVRVSDTGQGISPEFLPHLFERFWQADASVTRTHGGLGLGLTIVKHIVETHGGTIVAESAGEGRGATFTVSLPIMGVCHEDRESPGAEPGGPPVSSESADLTGVRVLLVDDEADTRDVLRRLLAERGAIVRAVGSGPEALDALAAEKPDVLLGDIGMPGMDGYEMMRRIRRLPREQGGDTPAVALTAYSRAEDRTEALLAGYEWHLTKPVEPPVLIATVAMITNRWRAPGGPAS
jgi:PAS domain S-box-containing protein